MDVKLSPTLMFMWTKILTMTMPSFKTRCLKLYCQCFALSTTCGPKCKCQTCYNTTLHSESIEEARKTILERNPSAFDDKFRGGPVTPSPYRGLPPPTPVYHHSSPPGSNWPPSAYKTPPVPPPPMAVRAVATPPGPPPPPPRVNKFGCKCRRSFCLKKVNICSCVLISSVISLSHFLFLPPTSTIQYCECFQNSVKCGLNCRCTNCRNYPHEGNGLPPPRPPPIVVPVTYGTVSPRCVSSDTVVTAASVTPAAEETAEKADTEDRMAIMAAVAMTELFGSKTEPEQESAVIKADENPANMKGDEIEGPTTPSEFKRKVDKISIVSSPERSDDDESTPPHKRPKDDSPGEAETSPGVPESRNPSPVSVMTPQNSYPRHFIQRPPSHHISSQHPPPPLRHHHPYHHPAAAMPPHPMRYAPRRTFHSYYPSPPQPRATSYEDVIKSSGLPKALSFRKICSKCGKTRGEHGELGFGNKCVFQDCGKCGAGVQMHTKAGSSMGILCRLTVDEGATPGAASTYERKIRELAARAELQKTLLEDKRVRVERLVAQPPFVSTA